jgi:hypothetical protein
VTPRPGREGYYSVASWRHAQQTRRRAAHKRAVAEATREVERLRRLGADEEWILRVTETITPSIPDREA